MVTVSASGIRILIVDDDPGLLELVRSALARDGVEIITAGDPQEGLKLYFQLHPEIVLLDLVMPQMSGMEMLERLIAADPGVDVILLTGEYSTDSAVQAIQKGARDYLTKPIELAVLRARVEDLLEEAEQRRRALELDQEMLQMFQLEGIVGRSPLMLEVFAKLRRIAPHFRTLLVTGATGTGKELVARAAYRLSPVSSARFVVCNCSAIAETLLESELFGYARGAFTGATQDKVGLFEYADGGVLFLDEIGDLTLAAQAKLLRVVQNHEIQRVGSPAVKEVDVCVIAATNRNLRELGREGKFRLDLYYRLAMVEIALPRLCDRREDLPLLQRRFVEKFAHQYNKAIRGISRRAQAVLSQHSWPGNVRELENALGNACMMARGEIVDVQDLPEYLRAGFSAPSGEEELVSLEEVQRRHVLRVLERLKGDKTRAAKILGISRATLYNMLGKMERAQAAG